MARFVLCAIAAAAFAGLVQAQELRWVNQVGSSLYDSIQGIAADAGVVYSFGDTGQTLPGQASFGGVDAFLIAQDPNGNVLWTRQFGTAGADIGYSVATRASRIYCTGYTTGAFFPNQPFGGRDGYLRSYDTAGNALWTTQFGTSATDWPISVAVNDTAVFVLGITNGVFPGEAGLGDFDYFLARIELDGTLSWVRQFGTAARDLWLSARIAADESGVYTAGRVPDGYTMDGQPDLPEMDAFLRKVDLDGNLLWTRQFGSDSWEAAGPVALDDSGVYVAGAAGKDLNDPNAPNPNPNNIRDRAFLRKFTRAGEHVWTRMLDHGGSGNNMFSYPEGITVDANGVVLTGLVAGALFPGEFRTYSNGDRSACETSGFLDEFDAYVREYGHDGSVRWTRQAGSVRRDAGHDVAVDGVAAYVGGITVCSFLEQDHLGRDDGFILRMDRVPSTHQGEVRHIVGQVETLWDARTLTAGQAGGLISKLEGAIEAFDAGNDLAAANKLASFENSVDAMTQGVTLTPAQGQALIDAAQAVIGAP